MYIMMYTMGRGVEGLRTGIGRGHVPADVIEDPGPPGAGNHRSAELAGRAFGTFLQQATQATSLTRSSSFAFPLGTPDEVEHERHGRGRVCLEQLVAGIENMGFHPRQRLHP